MAQGSGTQVLTLALAAFGTISDRVVQSGPIAPKEARPVQSTEVLVARDGFIVTLTFKSS